MDPSNLVLLRGVLSSDARSRALPSGTTLAQLDVTTPHPEGARSVPVAWFNPGATIERCTTGAEVVIVGHVRRRFFRVEGRATQSRTEVIVERLALGTRRRDIERLLQVVVERLTAPD